MSNFSKDKEIDSSSVANIEGHSINIAKRIETASRAGKFSKIFLSRDAAKFLQKVPVILERRVCDLKGIGNKEEIFEVKSAFLDDFPLKSDNLDLHSFVHHYTKNIKKHDYDSKPWLKSLVISVLESARNRIPFATKGSFKYGEDATRLIWFDPSEDDPIFIYFRAYDLEIKNKNLELRLELLKSLSSKYPKFFNAKIRLIRAQWEKALSEGDPLRIHQVQEMAALFKEKYLELFRDPTFLDHIINHKGHK